MSWSRITVKDLDTGEEESVEIEDDYVLICVGDCYLDHSSIFATGTHVLTVRNSKGRKRASTTTEEPAAEGCDDAVYP